MRLLCALLVTTSLVTALPQEQRAISLFNVVSFPNDECQSTKDTTNKGTCLSSTECGEKHGAKEGNCASGFGVCCIITIKKEAGGEVKHNNTIIENKGYPTAFSTKSKTATYKVKPLSNAICFLRFDFIKMDLAITASTGVCADTFTVTIPTKAGTSPKSLCGLNDGQHMYTDQGRQTTDTSVVIKTGTTVHSRKWKIKIAQINCDCPVLPMPGCTQFHTANCGTFQSMNFAATTQLMVSAFDSTICFRQNRGKCGITIHQESDETTKDSFSLLDAIAGGIAVSSSSKHSVVQSNTDKSPSVKDTCKVVRLHIGGAAYCGENLNSVIGSTAGGLISTKNFFVQTAHIGTDVKASKGFKLNYKQTGCS